jgi:hypothetical protein
LSTWLKYLHINDVVLRQPSLRVKSKSLWRWNISANVLCFWTLSIVLFVFQNNNVSETGFCLRLQVKPTQSCPINRASPYLQTHVPAPRWGIQAKHSTNHFRELRKH